MGFLPFSTKNYLFKSKKHSKAKLLNGIKSSDKVCTFYFVNIKVLISCILLVHCGRKKMTSVYVEVYDTEIWEYSFWTLIQFLICVMEPVTVKHWTNHLLHYLTSGGCL